jgi:4'-phosphopantetheinyl transferase
LDPDEVQVWTATLPPTGTDFSGWMALLRSDEQRRAERFLVEGPRRPFVFGRALLRRLIGDCLDVPPIDVVFGCGPRGKPFLDIPHRGRELQFNLTRADQHVAIVLSYGRSVGVDIESSSRLDDWSSLSPRVLSPRERREISLLPPALHREAFLGAWTCKEAYLKATGEGLTDHLAAIEVTLAPGLVPRLLSVDGDPETARRWTIRAIPLPEGSFGAVAVETA